HNLAGIHGTRDALKWVFEAEENEISPMYECGENNHLMVCALEKIHPIGVRSLKDEQINEIVKAEVIKDKKAEQLIAKAKGVNSIDAAKAKGANVSEVNQVTFGAPVFVPATGASEPALSGAVAATAKGKFSAQPVKGNAGVYMFQVVEKTQRPNKFDAKATEARLRQKAMQFASGFTNELYMKAKVVDNRYLFF
ncbi:MAG: peptidylprolyl isomerase, partial [Prevotella sp.]|nr:peptidylprolyl isomerase [Prevotella sp.]